VDVSSDVSSPAERALYFEVVERNTSGNRVNWSHATRDFNLEVTQRLQQEQQAGAQGNDIYPKTQHQMKRMEAKIVKEISRRDGAAAMEAGAVLASSSGLARVASPAGEKHRPAACPDLVAPPAPAGL
jgi:hypothetical protein